MQSHSQHLADALTKAIGPHARIAVIHSSLAALRLPEGFSRWDAMRAIRSVADRGVTLAFPAFTFSFCGGRPFQLFGSRSETGLLADWVAELDGAVRSPHPIYSFVLIGPDAKSLAACANSTTFGDDSIFAAFERRDATLMMMGCDWSYCTQFHRYEEEAKVPYRYFKDFTGQADFGDSAKSTTARMFVRDLAIDPKNDFSPAVDELRRNAKIASVPLWSGTLEAASCADLASVCRGLLSQSPLAFVESPARVDYALKNAASRASARPLRVALLGQANLALLEKSLREQLESAIPDRALEIVSPPFGQLAQFVEQIAKGGMAKPDFSLFVDRLEDLIGVFSLDDCDPDLLANAFDRHMGLLERYRETVSGPIVVSRYATLNRSALGASDRDRGGPAALAEAYNSRLGSLIERLNDVYPFDLDRAAACRRSASAVDSRLWHIGRFPFADDFSQELAREWTGLVLASLGKTARVIVVDLDNTLWGGVLGEDGIEGLMIGGDFPGNAFSSFQRTLLSLRGRGILLAACSKNDHDDALAVLRDHPGMLLRPDHFAALRIGWDQKWRGIQAICDELDLDVSNALFVDDNPAERELVRRNLPKVKVLDLPDDPTGYSDELLRSMWIGALRVTESDLKRPQQYVARRKVQEHRGTFGDTASFYASLGLKVRLSPIDSFNGARAAQLSAKTNQFNTTVRRYSRAELETRFKDRGCALVIGFEDRFSEFEHVGLLLLHADDPGTLFVDDYLLSCRILGRGVETGLLQWLCGAARDEGFARLAGEVVEMPRNLPARKIFADAGFVFDPEAGRWIMTLDSALPRGPAWLQVAFDGRLAPAIKQLAL